MSGRGGLSDSPGEAVGSDQSACHVIHTRMSPFTWVQYSAQAAERECVMHNGHKLARLQSPLHSKCMHAARANACCARLLQQATCSECFVLSTNPDTGLPQCKPNNHIPCGTNGQGQCRGGQCKVRLGPLLGAVPAFLCERAMQAPARLPLASSPPLPCFQVIPGCLKVACAQCQACFQGGKARVSRFK